MGASSTPTSAPMAGVQALCGQDVGYSLQYRGATMRSSAWMGPRSPSARSGRATVERSNTARAPRTRGIRAETVATIACATAIAVISTGVSA